MRSPLIGGFCAGVTIATASSWLTKFVDAAMAVNMVIVLLIREEECAFCNIFIMLIIIKDAAHVL